MRKANDVIYFTAFDTIELQEQKIVYHLFLIFCNVYFGLFLRPSCRLVEMYPSETLSVIRYL